MRIVIVIISTCLFFACQKKRSKTQDLPVSKNRIDTLFFSFDPSIIDSEMPVSELTDRASKLKELEVNYQVVKQGRIKKESSKVYMALLNKPELCYTKSACYNVRDLDDFKASIHSINYALIVDQKPENDNSPSEAEIEELVFYSASNAKILWDYIRHVRNVEYYWDSLDKTSSDMFVKGNKLYFVRMRKRRSMNYVRLIARKLKEDLTEK